MNTWNELSDYLLERMESFNGDSPMVGNPNITKDQYWNSQIGECFKYEGQRLPIKTKTILLKRIKQNFG